MEVRKAVITAAGRGTRFLPVTRSVPKEMLPLVDRPLIQYAVAEAAASGIREIVLITAEGKHAIEDYFERDLALEDFLESKGEIELLREMRALTDLADVRYVRQEEPLGLGHAVLTAREMVGDEPFAVILPDDIIYASVPALKQMLAVYQKYGASVIAVEKMAPRDSVKYGVIKPEAVSPGIHRVLGLVEKPLPAAAPSNLGVVGRYILTPAIFPAIEATPPGKIKEIQLTDALHRLLVRQPVYALEFEGTRYDTGTPLGLLEASVTLALKMPALAQELKAYLKSLL